MADELLTRSELLTYCPALSTVANATLDAYIDTASRMVENYCHREFASKSVTEHYPYTFTPNVFLKRTPVTAVSNVTLYIRSGTGDDTDNTSELSNMTETASGYAVGYTAKPLSGVMTIDPQSMRISSEVISSLCYYEINYTGGYVNIPTPVKAAVAKLVDSMATRWGTSDNVISEKIGDYSYTKTPSGPFVSPSNEVGILLGPYVKVGVNGI